MNTSRWTRIERARWRSEKGERYEKWSVDWMRRQSQGVGKACVNFEKSMIIQRDNFHVCSFAPELILDKGVRVQGTAYPQKSCCIQTWSWSAKIVTCIDPSIHTHPDVFVNWVAVASTLCHRWENSLILWVWKYFKFRNISATPSAWRHPNCVLETNYHICYWRWFYLQANSAH